MARLLLVLLSIGSLVWPCASGAQAAGQPPPAGPLERLAALTPSPPELLAPPAGFRPATPRSSDTAEIAAAIAEIEKAARTRGTAEDLHALAIVEIVRGSCSRAVDLLRIAIAAGDLATWRRDLAIALTCARTDAAAAAVALDEVLRALPREAWGQDALVLQLESRLGLVERVTDLQPSDYGARIAWAVGAGLFRWAHLRDESPASAAALAEELVATATEAIDRGDHTLEGLAAHLEAPGFAAAVRVFESAHLEYQRGDCRSATTLATLENLPPGLVLRGALMAAGCELQRDRSRAAASITAILDRAAAESRRWLVLRATWTLAIATAQSGDLEGAATHFRHALELANELDDHEAHLALATELVRLEDPESPAATARVGFLLEAASAQTSTRTRLVALMLASDLAAHQGFVWVAHAIASYGEQISLELTGAPRAEVLAWLASTTTAVGLHDRADSAVDSGLLALQGTNDPAATAIEARLRLSRTRSRVARNEHEPALVELELVEGILGRLGQNAGAAVAAAERGLLLARLDRAEEAIVALTRASEHAPDAATREVSRRALALILIDQGRAAEAWASLDRERHDSLLSLRRLADDEVVLFQLSGAGVSATRLGSFSDLRELSQALRSSLASGEHGEVSADLVAGFARRLFPAAPRFPADRTTFVELPRGLWELPLELAAPELALAFVVSPGQSVTKPPEEFRHPHAIEIVLGVERGGEPLPRAELEASTVVEIWDGQRVRRAEDPWQAMLESDATTVHVIAHGPIPSDLRALTPVLPRLVILNGCRTLGDDEPNLVVRDLTNAGAMVVGTMFDIDDDLGQEAAVMLHTELALGTHPAVAVRTAVAAAGPAGGRRLFARAAWRALTTLHAETPAARPSTSVTARTEVQADSPTKKENP